MKQILWATTLIALAPAALLAHEPGDHDGGPPRGEEMFKKWDTNGDGVISKDEATAAGADRVAGKFDVLDKDKDGQLTQEEMRQSRDDRMAAMKERFDTDFKAADKNGDGSLTKDEAQGMRKLSRHFDDVDANKDGMVSREEIETHHQQRRGRGHHRSSPQG